MIRDTVWLINLSVSATRTNSLVDPRYGRAGGAEVACFIAFPDRDGATELAKYYVSRDKEWRIGATGKTTRVRTPSARSLEYVREAIRAGYAIIYSVYPKPAKRGVRGTKALRALSAK